MLFQLKNKLKRYCIGLTAALLLTNVLTVNASGFGGGRPGNWGDWFNWGNAGGISHGTSDTLITEDMLNNTPDPNYTIDSAIQGGASEGAYNAYFLTDSLQTVSIEIDENNLNYLLQNAKDAPTVMATSVTIGDTTVKYCGFKTKGNYTLEHSYNDNPGSDRFSFTVNFGKYIKKEQYGKNQNFFGANKISFNNFFFDKSMMKEFFALKLMDEMGLPTPQYGLAKLYINGNYYGVYTMVEALDESILEQYYGVDDDELSNYLCKPTDTRFIYEELLEDNSALWEYDEETYTEVADMLPTVMDWVKKLNCLSNGTDFEGNAIDVNSAEYLELLAQIMDVDEVVKYFATHSWLCQMDNMFVEEQNFGLYVDQSGKCLIIPWDYDLSFGCYFPSNAESTANYDIEVMYKRNVRPGDDGKANAEFSANTYDGFPLFNVIYQNQELMTQYREYMKECSKIATLGGIIASTGKTYEPGYFNSFIEAMEEEIYAAASEDLADNVYYMNWTSQPRDVKAALPNVSKIIAMRSVGVLAQVELMGTTVTGEGCDLSTLGNAGQGINSSGGRLTAVESTTGIFATAEYEGSENPRDAKSPVLVVTELAADNADYQKIQAALEATEKDLLTAYQMSTTVAPTSGYELTIPLSAAYMKADGETLLYSYDAATGELTALPTTNDDNLYTATTDTLECIVVYQKEVQKNVLEDILAAPTEPDVEPTPGDTSENGTDSSSKLMLLIVMVSILVVILAIVGIRKRIHK